MNGVGEAGLPIGDSTLCPVPPEQRPIQEYQQLCSSWFFAWASGSALDLARPLTLAWLLAQGDDVTTIPGTRYPARLDENLGALKVSLSAADVARIDAAVPKGSAAGTRDPAGGMGGGFI